MNLIDAVVKEVLSNPELIERDWGSFWKVDVIYVDMGREGATYLTFDTKEEADKVKAGYKFKH